MDLVTTARFVRLSASKAQDFARHLQGLPVDEALRLAQFSPRKGAGYLHKTLKSAVANAQNNAKLAIETLRVKEAVVNEGPRMRRYWARARGSARPIVRRLCHVRIVLTDDRAESAG